MGYVAVAILVLLIVAAGVTFFVISAAGRRRGAPSIAAPDDETPVGTTDQHSDAQPRERGAAGGTAGGEAGLGGEAEGTRGDLPDSERLADRPR
jgi:hypothetical protein